MDNVKPKTEILVGEITDSENEKEDGLKDNFDEVLLFDQVYDFINEAREFALQRGLFWYTDRMSYVDLFNLLLPDQNSKHEEENLDLE